MREDSTESVSDRMERLSASQRAAIVGILEQFERSCRFERAGSSDIVSEAVLRELGDLLRIHHCFSDAPLTKDKLEHALRRAWKAGGGTAELAPPGDPGFDILLDGCPYSLKAQADRNIKLDRIHISKFMELGKGKWGDNPADLVGLRDAFLDRLRDSGRVVVLRYFRTFPEHEYELVEIPRDLLSRASKGSLCMMESSKQFPKPGTCSVTDETGAVQFELYFDAGSERKLQIRKIDKALCSVHARWAFPKDATIAPAGLP